ncbi:MAG TPA: hypothetical protein VI320_20850 [Terracidiphilus sp.]|jgi:hypothetical protein
MGTVVSISKGATDSTLPTLAEVKDELSTLAKIRGIIRARSTSESDKRAFRAAIAAEARMPADIKAQLQTTVEAIAQFPAITDAAIHAAIDSQLRVLSEGMKSEDVYDEFEGVEHEFYIMVNALDAAEWRQGARNAAPSKGWLDMMGDDDLIN